MRVVRCWGKLFWTTTRLPRGARREMRPFVGLAERFMSEGLRLRIRTKPFGVSHPGDGHEPRVPPRSAPMSPLCECGGAPGGAREPR